MKSFIYLIALIGAMSASEAQAWACPKPKAVGYDRVGCLLDGLAKVQSKGKFGFIDETGNVIIPIQYDEAGAFIYKEPVAKVSLNGKWGFIDKAGKVVIPIQYDDAGGFSGGLVALKKGNKWGYVNVQH